LNSSLPDGPDEFAASTKTSIGFDLRNDIRSVVGTITKKPKVGQNATQSCRIPTPTIDKLPSELRLDVGVRPMVTSGPNPILKQRRDGRLEAGVVAPVGAAIVAAVG
jgi:hypothetical protein